MARLIYLSITSLDGYIEDKDGKFDWSAPDEEVHSFANQLTKPIGTHLYGRRMYEVMVYWETAQTLPDSSPVENEYAKIWQNSDKIVYSTTLASVSSERTRLEREFDPEAVRQMKEQLDKDISVSGPELAAQAIRAGLVDDYQVLLNPVIVGGGKAALPGDVRLDLELVDEHRFGNGVVFLHYRTKT
ncbi:MAG TPA: dihydrofolate reductase family protein [Actinomycetota bacterium]|nr:dihydrofolate reductase family protein [Actinomycetota bacterium]